MQGYWDNFLKYKDLMIELTKKDITLKYRNSFLGIIWSVLNPLLFMLVLVIIFQEFFSSDIEYFAAYVLIGRLIYSCFSETTNFAMQSIVSNGGLIKKVYVPKYFFPISRVTSSFITSLLAMISLIPVMFLSGLNISLQSFYIILPLFYLLLISLGIGLILATIYTFFRDLQHLYSLALVIIMYTSAIFYPASIIPERYMPIIRLNPIFDIIEMIRNILIYGTLPSLQTNLFCLIYGMVVFVSGLWVFYKKQDKFIFYL
ncbi:ABC transporter permease [Paenibacillus sp. 2KB_22]|uniref:ABC transporter permease n=1 Tax=Paenibacillus sp. 2KB_22 TaxID=3232978 RepID=UPI003F98DFDE